MVRVAAPSGMGFSGLWDWGDDGLESTVGDAMVWPPNVGKALAGTVASAIMAASIDGGTGLSRPRNTPTRLAPEWERDTGGDGCDILRGRGCLVGGGTAGTSTSKAAGSKASSGSNADSDGETSAASSKRVMGRPITDAADNRAAVGGADNC